MYVSVVYGNPNGKIHLQNSAAVEQFWIHIDIYYKLLCIAFDWEMRPSPISSWNSDIQQPSIQWT